MIHRWYRKAALEDPLPKVFDLNCMYRFFQENGKIRNNSEVKMWNSHNFASQNPHHMPLEVQKLTRSWFKTNIRKIVSICSRYAYIPEMLTLTLSTGVFNPQIVRRSWSHRRAADRGRDSVKKWRKIKLTSPTLFFGREIRLRCANSYEFSPRDANFQKPCFWPSYERVRVQGGQRFR